MRLWPKSILKITKLWLKITKSLPEIFFYFRKSIKDLKKVIKTDLTKSGQWIKMKWWHFVKRLKIVIEWFMCNNLVLLGSHQLIQYSSFKMVETPKLSQGDHKVLQEARALLSWTPQNMEYQRVSFKMTDKWVTPLEKRGTRTFKIISTK